MRIRDIIETTTEREVEREFKKLRRKLVREMRLNEAAYMPPATPPSFFRGAAAEKFVKLLNVGVLALLAKPIYDYITSMEAAWKNYHDHGGSLEQYNENHANKAGMLVYALAANLASLMATSMGSAIIIRLIGIIPIIGPILSKILSLLSVGAKGYVLTQLNSQEGQLAIAHAITGNTIRDTGDFAVAAIDYIHGIVADALKLDKSTITPTKGAAPAGDNNNSSPSQSTQPVGDEQSVKALARSSNRLIDPLHANPGGYVPPGHYRDANGVLH